MIALRLDRSPLCFMALFKKRFSSMRQLLVANASCSRAASPGRHGAPQRIGSALAQAGNEVWWCGEVKLRQGGDKEAMVQFIEIFVEMFSAHAWRLFASPRHCDIKLRAMM
jgi:hypothetical protein